jgi:N utilization substance protein B
MKRSELREAIFKLLFMAQFNSREEMPEQVRLYFESLENGREEETFSRTPTEEDEAYMEEKYGRVMEKLPEIDELLNSVAEGWKTSRMGKVDLTILRLAVYEIRYDEEVPVGVAINEAVEIAKRFGGEESASFINGILGRIARGPEMQKDGPEEGKQE